MENGTLIITKSNRGKFNGKIEFTKKTTGKPGIFIITANIFKDDSFSGKKCEFKREKGALAELYVDKKLIYPDYKRKIQPKKNSYHSINQNNSNIQFDELFDAEKTCLPKDTKELLSNFEIDNYSLKLNKAAFFNENARPKQKFEFFHSERKGNSKFLLPNFGNIDFEKFKNKYEKLNYDKKLIELKQNWRMAVGLGHESVYETSITLHHIYGIPYIPASSIKGVVRSWIITEVFGQDNLEKAEEKALENKDFVKIFGKQESQGEIIFFDAFPIEEPTIEPDIMNVHYPDYYDDKKGIVAPTDYQSPRPIIFLTVKNTPFQFVIGSKKEQLDKYKISGQTIDWWLKEALENHGIGAKTAVGYGRMK